MEHPLVRLAAEAISVFLSRQEIIEPPESLFLEVPEALIPAGVFVCLKREGRLRGCIGTTEPIRRTMAAELIEIAIGAATRDPRFPPLEWAELDELEISVDVLGPSEQVWSLEALDHRRYGIMIRSGARHSVLLPDLEGINSVAAQVETAREKAGLGSDEVIELLRFEVTRYR
ncbi:MAG: AmmeMemoRadiSam system protein A [Nitrospiraceae bacterium]